jgi:predicted Fe-Mo cluster-binding NifX family protein
MKIAITSTGPNLDSTIDPRFGRAPWLLVVDSETGSLEEALDNQAGCNAAQGAGITAAAMVSDRGVQQIYTGRLGPKARAVTDKSGIEIIENCSGSVKELVGNLQEQSGPATDSPAPASGIGRGRCRSGGGGGRGSGQGKGMGRCRR